MLEWNPMKKDTKVDVMREWIDPWTDEVINSDGWSIEKL